MYVHKETLTINNPKILVLSKPLPLTQGQRIEIVIKTADEDVELEALRDSIAAQDITQADIDDAIQWARSSTRCE
jgi:hypothetical protein